MPVKLFTSFECWQIQDIGQTQFLHRKTIGHLHIVTAYTNDDFVTWWRATWTHHDHNTQELKKSPYESAQRLWPWCFGIPIATIWNEAMDACYEKFPKIIPSMAWRDLNVIGQSAS